MRLIDADKLIGSSISDVNISAFFNGKMHRYIDVELIEQAPTVDDSILVPKNTDLDFSGMSARLCVKCGEDSLVYDTRDRSDGTVIRRRRCRNCGFKQVTIESLCGFVRPWTSDKEVKHDN